MVRWLRAAPRVRRDGAEVGLDPLVEVVDGATEAGAEAAAFVDGPSDADVAEALQVCRIAPRGRWRAWGGERRASGSARQSRASLSRSSQACGSYAGPARSFVARGAVHKRPDVRRVVAVLHRSVPLRRLACIHAVAIVAGIARKGFR